MKAIENLSKEFQAHKVNQDYLNREELKKVVWKELSAYFSHKENFEIIWKYNQIITGYNMFVLNKEIPFFIQAFRTFHSIFERAKNENHSKTFQILSQELRATSRAIQNYAELFHLEQDKNISRLDLFAKSCFRDIGEILEGSVKQFSKVLLMIGFQDEVEKIKDMQKASFGSIVSLLLRKGLEDIYTIGTYDITINQLRNIAFHADYSIDHKNNLTICSFGSNKTLKLTRNELLDILLKVNQFYAAHKLSYEFFMMDNLQEINPEKQKIDITEDSILVSIYEIAYAYGFKVVYAELSSSIAEIKIQEFKRYDSNIKHNTRTIAIQICQVLRKGINLVVVPFFDIAPFTLQPRLPTSIKY
jgi:hypothetical protein